MFPYEFDLYVRVPPIAIWYLYYARLEDFIALFRDRHLYVHGRVLLPVPATREIRSLVYQLFIFNTPFYAYDLIQIQRFRLFFVHVEGRTSARIEELYLHPYPGGPSFYQEDGLWT